ncbi:MAG: hypothetical protein ABJP48_07925 [Erythrobacter sp.]
MKRTAILMSAAIAIGAVAITSTPVEAKRGGGTSAASASGKRPGTAVYSKKTTSRAPARTAASVLQARDRAQGARNVQPYRAARSSNSRSSARNRINRGQSARAITNTAKPGVLTRIANWFGSFFSGKPKAQPRKVTFRERTSVELQRLVRLPNGQVGPRPQ